MNTPVVWDADDAARGMSATGITVSLERGYAVASLRHFGRGALADIVGALPDPLHALIASDPGVPMVILAWRSPSDTLLLCKDAAQLAALQASMANRSDVSVVEQTGGLWVWALRGERVVDLIVRLGGTESMPALNEARVSRLAEVTVMALCVQPGEILLVVDRVYAPHLAGWIRETLADL